MDCFDVKKEKKTKMEKKQCRKARSNNAKY
jgi:hypothetical protein